MISGTITNPGSNPNSAAQAAGKAAAANPAAATTGSTEGRALPGSKQLDPAAQQDRFLKLLVAQMNNQDPMNPVDNAQMTSQMAQINTVSGIQQLNDTLKGMSGQFGSMQLLQGASLVGKGVLIDSDHLHLRNGQVKGAVDLDSKAENVQVEILDASDKVVGKVDLGSQEAGLRNFSWDASQYKGDNPLSGPLRARASAGTATNPVSARVLAEDEVTSVGADKQDGLALGLAENGNISYQNIKAIH